MRPRGELDLQGASEENEKGTVNQTKAENEKRIKEIAMSAKLITYNIHIYRFLLTTGIRI